MGNHRNTTERSTKMNLGISIPMYNEEGNAERVISRMISHLDSLDISFVLAVVNNGSNDATGVVLDRIGVRDERVIQFISSKIKGTEEEYKQDSKLYRHIVPRLSGGVGEMDKYVQHPSLLYTKSVSQVQTSPKPIVLSVKMGIEEGLSLLCTRRACVEWARTHLTSTDVPNCFDGHF